MRKLMFLAVTIAAVIGYPATANVFNFRGGHGGGHHGGHHSGHHAHHNSHHHNGHHTHRHVHHSVHHHGDRPFTHGWYGHHAGAWGWNNGAYGWGNPWAYATLGTAAAWLGASAWENAAWGGNNSTVYTAANGNMSEEPAVDEQAETNADQNSQVADNADDNADDTADNGSDDAQANAEDQPAVAPSAAEAKALARLGANDTLSGAQFLTLGVYSLAPAGQDEATGVIHLAVAKNGALRGTFADLKTDKDQNIQGSVDKKTGRVAWTVGPESKDVFETSIQDLTQQSGPLTIHTNDGQTSEWTIAHYEPLEAENDPPYDANPAKTQQEKTSHRPNSLFGK